LPVVLVHGVPDTTVVWGPLDSQLRRDDVIRVALPGFGCPRDPGFGADMDSYAAWLIDKLSGFGQPVHAVGHDWGGMLVLRAASLAPECVSSWAIGGAPIDPAYRWHRLARLWQTPVVGELVMGSFTEARMTRALTKAAVPPADAARAARGIDRNMKACVLALYRSAKRVGAQWGGDLDRITRPGLVLWGEHDPYAAPHFGERIAGRTGAAFRLFAGCGHWWQSERPGEVAEALHAFWTGIDGKG